MSKTHIPTAMRRAVIRRAARRCEYCMIADGDLFLPHEPDHIIAEVHNGQTVLDNLALACFDCNRHKGSNISSIDSETGELTRLFNPRIDEWGDHFSLREARIVPKTAIGRVTARLLQFNTVARIRIRAELIISGDYP